MVGPLEGPRAGAANAIGPYLKGPSLEDVLAGRFCLLQGDLKFLEGS